MDDGNLGDYTLIHNGGGLENVFNHVESGLTSGLSYRFYVIAENGAGLSEASAVSTIYACIDPSGFAAPTYSAVTVSQVDV